MMAAKLSNPGGQLCLMLVLEPGNIEKLKTGAPIHKWAQRVPARTDPAR